MALGEFLKEIKKNPSSVKFAEMANILVIHCQAAGEDQAAVSSSVFVVLTVGQEFSSGCSPLTHLAFLCHYACKSY